MKAYFIVTALLFTLFAGAHVWRTITHWSRFPEPGFLVEGPGLGLLAGALAFWGWRLLLASRQRA